MKVRSFQIADKKTVIDLWKDCELVVPWNNPDKDIERKIKVGSDLFLVGELDNKLIAAVMGGYEGHRGWANYLAVQPRHQGKGFARQMMKALESRLLEKGCPKINLQIRKTNVDVIRFYESLGYKVDASISLGKRLIPD